jgi:soluble lytic murein transglycosylase
MDTDVSLPEEPRNGLSRLTKHRSLRRALAALLVITALAGPYAVIRGAHWWHDRTVEERINRYSDIIWRYAEENALATELVRAVIRAESGGRPRVVSPSGAVGLMQITPAAESDALERLNIPKGDLFDPDYNIRVGATYLGILTRRFNNDLFLTLGAYHMGSGRVQKIARDNPGLTSRELIDQFAPPATVRYCHSILGGLPARQGPATQ